MSGSTDDIAAELGIKLDKWLEAEGHAKSTLAGTLTVLNRLAGRCPLTDADVFTSGGQLSGGRGAALFAVLKAYGVPDGFLSDGVTTRSTEKFRRLLVALDYGRPLEGMSQEERAAIIQTLATRVTAQVATLLQRQHVTVTCDRRSSPLAWVEGIFSAVKDRSQGRVEQHLVGAKLEILLPGAKIGREAAAAADAQTGRSGDFRTSHSVYHVTAAPSRSVITRCKRNIAEGKHPVLLVPRATLERAKGLAEAQGIEGQVSVFAMEDFLAYNIVELADARNASFMAVLQQIVQVYNERIEEAETDASLRIELR